MLVLVRAEGFRASAERCVRCHACATLAPEVFAVRTDTVTIVRQPQTPDEQSRAMAALLVCPAQAIGVGGDVA